MNDTYLSIKAPSEGQFREKGSRFLAFSYPVETEEEIKIRLEELHKKYHDARHHCYAWRLGAEMDRYRVNDDGEPSGSAGKPIFGQIESRTLTCILVVVVRYFGGTLLGVGGLIRAYRAASAAALDNAKIISRKVELRVKLEFNYPQMNEVMRCVKDLKLGIERQNFDLDCSMELLVWSRLVPELKKRISKIEGCKMLYL